MKAKKRLLKKDIVLLMALIMLYFVLQFVLQSASRIPVISGFKGVFSALQYGVCLLMLLVNTKLGTKIALFLMSVSVLTTSMAIAHGGRDAVPGLMNVIFYIITIIVISWYDTKRETESRTDYITEVYNRKGLYIMLQEKIQKGIDFNIIYVSLSNFKAINDTYGHAYGDELLRKVSKRIERKFGKDCIIARVGGADFVVAVEGKKCAQEAANGLLETLKEKTILAVEDNRVECYADGYAGVSSFPKDAQDYESLIKFADVALTEAIAKKSKEACLFSAEMVADINRQIQVQKMIKEALARGYFFLMYQPQFETQNKKLRGFETLLRMKNADGELVSPAEFIPVAEKSNLIIQIDDYVISNAMKEFKDVVLKNPELVVSINVSAKNFGETDFVEKIERNISDIGFPASSLEIEITEYCMLNSMETTRENINALRKLGVKIALDDFGTGYTALSYVASLPFNLLKIDKSLIDDIESLPKRRDFVRDVITMGQHMEFEVIAEGVEQEAQVNCLRDDGCNFIQGFVWGRPISFDEAVKLVK